MLLQANANPHLKLSDGSNAVMIASYYGNYEVVELLINKGVDYITQQAGGWNNFMLASQNGHTKIVELLLKKKVDPYVPNNNGWNALMLACHNGHTQIVEHMLNSKEQAVIKKNINAKNENGSTALMIACNTEKEHSEIVQLLLDAGADPHVKIKHGKTALASAMNLGHKIIVHKLLKFGAATTDVISVELNEAGVSIEMSIIQLCVGKLMKESHWIKFVRLRPTLAKIFADDLEITVEQFVEEVKQFISKTNEADIIEILCLLLQATPQCEDDPTSLVLASTIGNVQAVDMLLKAGYNPVTSLSSSKYFQAISTIMQPASTYKEAMKISCPSLVIACIEGHLELVKSLLRKIHDTNHQQETGETFLMFACDHKDIVQTLLQNGGDPNICDDDGDNVLHYVLLSNSSEDIILDLIKILLLWNINVDAQNNNGITPLMIARDKKYTKVLPLLSSKRDPIHPDSIESYGRTTKSSLMGVTAENIKEKFRKVEYLIETFCFYDLQRYQTPTLPTLMVH
ncbi:PREDICTED: ankyrin repeat domain-containing protein 50-like [Amphimedon queenslandica]|nr:PREDICTED: ankyrin repeat domain-containing protein 50-like [Amphimedon queenslandica]|eukprot:XP_019853519.1 PREDICTED: ankyrin repeat domain-containing protein 50-like [Amphimedon queenslandica]